jgi:type I restriction enzyme S subunit
MTGRYKAYPEYKPTDDAHVNKLPIGWLMKPLGLVSAKGRTSFVDGPFGSDLKSNEYQDEGIPLIQLNNITIGKHILQNMKYITEEKMNQLSRHIAKPNDIVIAKMADPVARAATVNDKFEKYVIVADCVKLTVDTSIVDLNYVIHAINSKEVNSSAELVSTGTTRIRINLTELKNLKIPFPPLVVQQKIANFLGHETAKIDTLISKQEKLIELLKEKRQAVISHAVTKGLNPDAPMKDSGVEWLGEVPEHWLIPRIKQIVSTPVTDGPHETPVFVDEGIPFISAEAVSQGFVNFKKIRAHITEKQNAVYSLKYSPEIYDIYMVKSGATTGVTAIVETNDVFNIWSPLAVIRCKKNYYPYFVLNFMRSLEFLKAVELNWSFGTQQNIGMGVIENLHIACPPIEEAIEIAKYINSKLNKYELIIKKSNKQVTLMKERKIALISAAVTGKIDVRNWIKG